MDRKGGEDCVKRGRMCCECEGKQRGEVDRFWLKVSNDEGEKTGREEEMDWFLAMTRRIM